MSWRWVVVLASAGVARHGGGRAEQPGDVPQGCLQGMSLQGCLCKGCPAGISPQGIRCKGCPLQGISPQGISLQGTQVSGVALLGTDLLKTELAGVDIASVDVRGTTADSAVQSFELTSGPGISTGAGDYISVGGASAAGHYAVRPSGRSGRQSRPRIWTSTSPTSAPTPRRICFIAAMPSSTRT